MPASADNGTAVTASSWRVNEEEVMDAAVDCAALEQAVITLSNEACAPEEKAAARKVCKSFTKCRPSPTYAKLGLWLASEGRPNAVRHYGLQALNYCVSYLWDLNSLDMRKNLRDGVLQLISEYTEPVSVVDQTRYIEDQTRYILVEIIKQDWPEHWSGLFSELSALCKKGPLQAELVLHALLRVEEHTRNLPDKRWSIIDCALQRDLHEALDMVTNLHRDLLVRYQIQNAQPTHVTPNQDFSRLMATTLKTLAGLLNRVEEPLYITENNFQLLDILWCLLLDPHLQLEAAECLLIAIKKISSEINSKPLLVLFAHVDRQYIFPVVQTTVAKDLTDRHYYFLKNMCQIACFFGQQLCSILGTLGCMTPPSNFEHYLVYLLGFTSHCSQRLSFLTQSTWKSLFSHKLLSSDPRLLAVLHKYLLTTRTHLMKIGFPYKANSPTCRYSRFEFATDEDFCKFLSEFRNEQKRVIDVACELDKSTCYCMAIDWVSDLLLIPHCTNLNCLSSDDLCDTSTKPSLQWEAMTFYLKIITTRPLQNFEIHTGLLIRGTELFELLLKFKTKDPLVLSFVPSIVSTLLPLFRLNSVRLPKILTKLLEVIQDIKTQKALPPSSAGKDAFSCLCQICRENVEFPFSGFEMLFSKVMQLLSGELLQLTEMEKSLLIEAMVLLINQFKNYEQQKAYLEELMSPVSSFWLSEEIQKLFANPKAFVSYVGADFRAIGTIVESSNDINRSVIIHCIASIIGVLRWTRCPTDHKQVYDGGFLGNVPNGKLICRNPCADQVLKLLDNVLLLINTQHNLYVPEVLSDICDMCDLFPLVLDRVEVRSASTSDIPQPLLNIYDPPEYKTALDRIQGFFSALYDCCFYILGCAALELKDAFYDHDFVNRVCNMAFKNVEFVPNYRHLSMVRFFLKPLLSSCPPEYYKDLMCSIMISPLPYIYALSCKWNVTDQGYVANKKKTTFTNTKSHDVQPKRLKLMTEEVMECVFDCYVSNKDENAFVADVADGTSSHEESPNVVTSEEDFFIVTDTDVVSSKVNMGADAVCTTESDDDECTIDECSETVAAGNYVQCSMLNEKAKSSVVLEECDFNCDFPCEKHKSLVVFDKPFSLAVVIADPKVVLDKANSFNSSVSDNECPSTIDECRETVAAENYVQCSMFNEKAEGGVVFEECDFTCDFSCCENLKSFVDFDNSFSPALVEADPTVVLDKANDVCSSFINHEDGDDGEFAAEILQPDQPVSSKLTIFSE